MYRLVETGAPTALPLRLLDTKKFLRVESDYEDDFITGLIATAQQLCEQVTGRALITRSYSYYLDQWPQRSMGGWWDGVREGAVIDNKAAMVNLPMPPMISVTRINTYSDSNVATEFAASNYFVDNTGTPARILIKNGGSIPTTTRAVSGIEIQYKAGYGNNSDNVPPMLRQALLQIVAHLFENRGDTGAAALAASGALPLLQSYRVMSLV